MTKQTMIKNYRKFSAADCYALGFIYEHNLYVAMVDEIAPRFMRVEHESSKKGGCAKLQLRLTKPYQLQLIRKGAKCVGGESLLDGKYNKGENFEKMVTEFYGQTWEKDNVPFTDDGDLTVNGVAYQIKFEKATFTNEKSLARMM